METTNKIAVITGAGSGIGRGIAQLMAQVKYNIVAVDLDLEAAQSLVKEIEATGVKGLAVKCDVSKTAEVDELFNQAAKEFGKIDVLVNNAGIFPFVPFKDMTEADWDKVMDVNLKSVFLCSRAGAKVMPDGGRIISISSIASLMGFEGLTHYCASKGGINGLTRALALEMASRQITVNAVAPGAIDTPGAANPNEEMKKQTIAMIPLGRMGLPADIANAVVFLAYEYSSYITGQVIVVDGGWTLR